MQLNIETIPFVYGQPRKRFHQQSCQKPILRPRYIDDVVMSLPFKDFNSIARLILTYSELENFSINFNVIISSVTTQSLFGFAKLHLFST